MFVKPAPGMLVRNPVTKQHLPPEGAEVPELGPAATYWHRRLRSGEVVRATAPAAELDSSAPAQSEVANS